MKAILNGKEIDYKDGQMILDVARENDVYIPTLCEMNEINHTPGTCRVCSIEISRKDDENKYLVTACNTPMEDGISIYTKTKKVRSTQKLQTELLLADHNADCTACTRYGDCELQDVARYVGIKDSKYRDEKFYMNRVSDDNDSSRAIMRDMSKCIRCMRCEAVCRNVQGVGGLTIDNKGLDAQINFADVGNFEESVCAACGQCTLVCPVGALTERNDVDKVIDYLYDPEIITVAQFAPAVRVALGEEFHMDHGTIVTGQINAALKKIGVDHALDTNFTADVVIMEEGHELLQRVNEGGTLPLFTSCSPGWINFVEKNFPELLPNVSTTKSPQQCFGALAKTYLAEKLNVDPKKMRVISIMPCTAKKEEAAREEHKVNGMREVDVVLTTRELAQLLKREQVDLAKVEPITPDNPFMGDQTGAAVIFGATGGVMEAALRTVYEVVNGEPLADLNITPVRGLEGIKEAEVELKGLGKVKVAVAHGLKAARKVAQEVKDGNSPYAFIEFMACPGGCMGGGGQPKHKHSYKKGIELRKKGLYTIDSNAPLRKSHNNPQVQFLYEDFLEKPLSHKSHELLHTTYTDKKRDYEVPISKIWKEI